MRVAGHVNIGDTDGRLTGKLKANVISSIIEYSFSAISTDKTRLLDENLRNTFFDSVITTFAAFCFMTDLFSRLSFRSVIEVLSKITS